MARIHTTSLRSSPQVLPTPLIRAPALPIRIGLQSRGAGGKEVPCSKKRPNSRPRRLCLRQTQQGSRGGSNDAGNDRPRYACVLMQGGAVSFLWRQLQLKGRASWRRSRLTGNSSRTRGRLRSARLHAPLNCDVRLQETVARGHESSRCSNRCNRRYGWLLVHHVLDEANPPVS